MKHIIKILAGLVLVLGMATACDLDNSTAGTKAKDKSSQADQVDTTDDADAEPAAEEPEPPAEPDPDVRYSQSCEYLLGDFSDYTPSGFRFVADAQLRNTGNVGVVAQVTAIWFQAGGTKITEMKTVKVPYKGHARVGFLKQVGSDEIDLIQALDYDAQCKVHAAMVDTYGAAH